MTNISSQDDPYHQTLEAGKISFEKYLGSGNIDVKKAALARRIIQIMDYQLSNNPKSVFLYDSKGGPRAWFNDVANLARSQVFPDVYNRNIHSKKISEYKALSERLIGDRDSRKKYFVSPTGNPYVFSEISLFRYYPPTFLDVIPVAVTEKGAVYSENFIYEQVVKNASDELMTWANKQEGNRWFYTTTAEVGIRVMLEDYPEIPVQMRITQRLPQDSEEEDDGTVGIAVMQAAIEIGVSFIPYVGNAVALYEFGFGVDLFGRKLSNVERALIGSSVLLAVPGAVRAGSKIMSKFGAKAAEGVKTYEKIVAAEAILTKETRLAEELESAVKVVKSEKIVSSAKEVREIQQLITQGTDAMPVIFDVIRKTAVTPKVIPLRVIDFFNGLSRRYSIIRNVDFYRLYDLIHEAEKILDLPSRITFIKGNLLEMFVDSKIVPWISIREGIAALGHGPKLTNILGKASAARRINEIAKAERLLYYPARSSNITVGGKQVTDGIIGFINKQGLFEIVGIIESKTGVAGLRELTSPARQIGSQILSDLERLGGSSVELAVKGIPAPIKCVLSSEVNVISIVAKDNASAAKLGNAASRMSSAYLPAVVNIDVVAVDMVVKEITELATQIATFVF